MKIRLVIVAAGALAVLGAACTTTEPDTLGVESFEGQAATEETTTETTDTTAAPVAAVASTCNVVREALLTGDQADIDTAMAALKADTAADATAREYADYYMGRDAGDPSMREMDVTLIRSLCSF